MRNKCTNSSLLAVLSFIRYNSYLSVSRTIVGQSRVLPAPRAILDGPFGEPVSCGHIQSVEFPVLTDKRTWRVLRLVV